MKVAKFGGSSLADAQQIKKVCDIITADPDRKIIVLSAPGKRHKQDIKVTDLLIALATQHAAGLDSQDEYTAVINRFADIINDLSLPESILERISVDINSRLNTETATPEGFMDLIKAAGEDNCAKLVACYLQSLGVEADYVSPRDAGMILSNEPGNARVLPESYTNLAQLRHTAGITIFPGFFGYAPDGTLVTFPRGGSDITGSILAAATHAELYENFTDVDSVFSANPTVVDNPQPIKEMTYREMRELSYAGFAVFNAEALDPVYRAGVPVCIKNTNNPSAPGTMIVPTRKDVSGPVIGIACDTGFSSIFVSKYLMNREIGFGQRLLGILADEGLSYEHTPSGIDNISVILSNEHIDQTVEHRIVERIQEELDVDNVNIEHDHALIMLVGEGMRRRIGVAARATAALADGEVNLEMINQGSSEVSMMFGVKASQASDAVRALYKEFFPAS